MRHYEPLSRIQNVDEYEDYDGFFYYEDGTYMHVRAFFTIVLGRRTGASMIFMLKSAPHGDELWPRPVDVPVSVAKLENVLGLLEQPVMLTEQDVDRLIEAIDSHQYWQLSEDQYRNSGHVMDPGSDDPEACADLAAYEALSRKLLTHRKGDTPQ